MKSNFINKIIFGVIIIGFGTGIKYSFDSFHTKEKQIKQIKQIQKSSPVKILVTEEITKIVAIDTKPLVLKKRTPLTFEALKVRAGAGVASAQSELGVKYYKADGVLQDYKLAYFWLSKAAKQNDANAQFLLGFMYLIDSGLPPDKALAAEWFLKSSKQGNSDAQLLLSNLYLVGQGVPEDEEQGKMWLASSAKQGNSSAQYTLGQIYYDEHDYSLAKTWFKKSAVQGDKLAQTMLGEMFLRGQGGPTDYQQAYKWLSLAANRGYKRAIKRRTEIELEMSVAQIDEAKKLVEK